MGPLRKPLQGVRNIVRFNWHFYLIALVLALVLGISWVAASLGARGYIGILLAMLLAPVLASLAVLGLDFILTALMFSV